MDIVVAGFVVAVRFFMRKKENQNKKYDMNCIV